MPMPDGRIGHAEVAYNGHTVMLASAFEELGFLSPISLAGVHSQIHIRVDDVEAHYECAKRPRHDRHAPEDQHGMRNSGPWIPRDIAGFSGRLSARHPTLRLRS